VEFEFLAAAVRAKRSGFETLREVAAVDDRLDPEDIDRMVQQANRQHEWLTHARREIAADLFGGQPKRADEAAGD
jgi:oligoendopeptidase F